MLLALFEAAVRATLIAGAVALVLRAMHIESSAVRHAAWSAVVMVMLLLPLLAAWGPTVSFPVLPGTARGSATAMIVVDDARAASARSEGSLDAKAPLVSAAIRWQRYLGALYLLGLGTLLFRLAAGSLQVKRLLRDGVLEKGRMTHPSCVSPVAVGWFRPTVIVPPRWSDWSLECRDAILAHEAEHVRRRDPLVKWVALLNRALFWFHPLAWWLERQVSALAEEACDRAVLSRGHAPGEYADSLLQVARSARDAVGRVPTLGMAMAGTRLSRRVALILDGAEAQHVSQTRRAWTATLCALSVVILTTGTLGQTTLAPERQRSVAAVSALARQAKAEAAYGLGERGGRNRPVAEGGVAAAVQGSMLDATEASAFMGEWVLTLEVPRDDGTSIEFDH